MNGEITSIKVNGAAQPIENHSVNIETGGEKFRVNFVIGEENADGFAFTANCTAQEFADAYLAEKEIQATLTLSDYFKMDDYYYKITKVPLTISEIKSKANYEKDSDPITALQFYCAFSDRLENYTTACWAALRFSPFLKSGSTYNFKSRMHIAASGGAIVPSAD